MLAPVTNVTKAHPQSPKVVLLHFRPLSQFTLARSFHHFRCLRQLRKHLFRLAPTHCPPPRNRNCRINQLREKLRPRFRARQLHFITAPTPTQPSPSRSTHANHRQRRNLHLDIPMPTYSTRTTARPTSHGLMASSPQSLHQHSQSAATHQLCPNNARISSSRSFPHTEAVPRNRTGRSEGRSPSSIFNTARSCS